MRTPAFLGLMGVAWFLVSLLMGSLNDAVMQFLGADYSSFQITFLRFLWAVLTLLPFMLARKTGSFKTERLGLHAARGALLFLGMALWTLSLQWVSISTATVITFTIPFFTLLLAIVILKERVSSARWLATALGMLGTLVVLHPTEALSLKSGGILLSVVCFALLDVINKKYVDHEPMLAMLFYSSGATVLFSLLPACFFWKTVSIEAHACFFFLGASSNFLLYALLKAFKTAEISLLAPFRYCELLFSTSIGFLLYQSLPPLTTWIGAAIIIPSSLFVIYEAQRRQRTQ